jgi:rhamnosyl/mannosyltransferase
MRSSEFLAGRRDRCSVIGLCVDAQRFSGAQPMFPPVAVPTLLFVGRHRYYKGVDDLIRAMIGMRARLIVAGDGPERAAWQRLAGELGLGERVVFVGEVKDADLPGLYAAADVFVLPANSRAEAFGQVLLEAMAAGLPCVTTELGTGTSEVVRDGATGLVVSPRDPDMLRIAITRLLDDPEKRTAMGRAGRTRALAEFTPQILLENVLQVYGSVVSART